MQSYSPKEAKRWCSTAALRLTSNGSLRYTNGSASDKFFVGIPQEHNRIVVLARSLLLFRGEADFSGGLVWLRRWDIGAPEIVRAGWLILESIRRAHGDSQSLELAPAQFFRGDEFVELQCFLTQVMAFGWVAEFVPAAGGFFAHFKDNNQICFTSGSPETHEQLRKYYTGWSPTMADPMLTEMAEIEKARGTSRGRPQRVEHQ